MNLPSGTVTFLFTDIEGSTKLAQELRETWESLRARHHVILLSAMEAHNGYVFQIIGDAFCVAFHTAGDALCAAVKAQTDLFNEEWGDTPIRVRMGIHTGKAELQSDGQYHGYLAMSRVQRLMSAAHGGQVLVSLAVEELVRDDLPEDVVLRDMGERRLKDLIRPEHVFQLVIANLPADFPPIKTLDAYRHNLPVQLTSFIGREKEMEQIAQSIAAHRLVTLTGVGGTGKTRLALQVAANLAEQFTDGVWFVELAPITDPELILQTILTVFGIVEQQGRTTLQIVTDYIRERNLLLVLDNCEHLIQACAQITNHLLNQSHALKIVATSREALNVKGEVTWHVPSLSLPDVKQLPALEHLTQYEAVQLFIERALLVQPDFSVTNDNASFVAQICYRLDGIPLAIELATSRVRALSVDQIAKRIDDRFRLLTGGSRTALERHQTLRATIDWSYNLLTAEEKKLFRSLAVFSGGWTLDAAESVCSQGGSGFDILDLMTQLVDKSLVNLEDSRYRMLETIRQYAREKLVENEDVEQLHARHLDYCIGLAEKTEQELHGTGQVEWSQKIEAEYENMRAALEWSLQENILAAQRLAAALWWSWSHSGYFTEGYQWLEKMLVAAPNEETISMAKMLAGASFLAERSGINERVVEPYSQASVDLFRKLGNREGAAFPLSTLARCAYFSADRSRAMALAEESCELFISSGNKWGIVYAIMIMGNVLRDQGNIEQAKKLVEDGLAIYDEIGNVEGKGYALYMMGNLNEGQGNVARAAELYEQALIIGRSVKDKLLTSAMLQRTGLALMQLGKYEKSRSLFEEELEMERKVNNLIGISDAICLLGWCARLQGNFPEAFSYYRGGLQSLKQLGNEQLTASCLLDIGVLLGRHGYPEKFARLFGKAQERIPNILDNLVQFSKIETRQSIEDAQATLGEETYTAAYNAGRQMTLDEAVAYALKELEQ